VIPKQKTRPEVVDQLVAETLAGGVLSSAADITPAELREATRQVKAIAKRVDTSVIVAAAWATYSRALEAMEFGTAAKLITIMQSLLSSSTPLGFTIKLGSLEEIGDTRSALNKALVARRVSGYDAQVVINMLNRAESELRAEIVDAVSDGAIDTDEDAEALIARIHAEIFDEGD